MMENNFRSIAETDFLSDSQMEAIEAGSCDSGCKKACQPGNQNAGNGNPPVPQPSPGPNTEDNSNPEEP